MAFTLNPTGLTGNEFGLGVTPNRPATSARAILAENPNAPNGYYWISWPGVLGGHPLETYCDMTGNGGSGQGGTVGGWMRCDTALFEQNRRLVQYQVGGSSQYSDPFMRWTNASWGWTTNNLSKYWVAGQVDGTIRSLKWRVPSGTRGIRITKWRMYSVGGADWPGWDDRTASSPTTAQIISAAEGNGISLGSNYTSFGVYIGDGNGNGRRIYRTSNGDYPTNAEAPYGGYVTLTQNSFVPYDDIGSNADRVIWYETDSSGEYENLYQWTMWIR